MTTNSSHELIPIWRKHHQEKLPQTRQLFYFLSDLWIHSYWWFLIWIGSRKMDYLCLRYKFILHNLYPLITSFVKDIGLNTIIVANILGKGYESLDKFAIIKKDKMIHLSIKVRTRPSLLNFAEDIGNHYVLISLAKYD